MTQQTTPHDVTGFCHQFVDLAQFQVSRQFTTGSVAEIYRSEGGMQKFGLTQNSFDVDCMIYWNDNYAFSIRQRVPEVYNGKVLRIYVHGMHPGYTKLLREVDHSEFKHIKMTENFTEGCRTVHGPAIRQNRFNKLNATSESTGDVTIVNSFIHQVDYVYAVHSPYWPTEASEWITRTRRHACPFKSVIKQVVRYGCDFVGVAHKLSPNRNNKNEWRFSFSMAELVIIRSWTRSQRIVYRTLRLVHKVLENRMAKKSKWILCTYYFKALMLWECEQQPSEFWTDSSLVETVRHLLTKMCEWLTMKHCPNYFIPGNNMMDHLRGRAKISKNVFALRGMAKDASQLVCMISECRKDEEFCTFVTYQAEMPCWIHRSLLIMSRIRNSQDSYNALFSTKYSSQLSEALRQELTGIYVALLYCQKIGLAVRNAMILDTNDKLVRTACGHLNRVLEMSKAPDRRVVDLDSRQNHVAAYYSPYDNQRAAETLLRDESNTVIGACEVDKSCFLSSLNSSINQLQTWLASQTKYSIASPVQLSKSITVLESVKIDGVEKEHLRCYRYWPGVSPTVNASWFIAKAYLANLYYTACRDDESTVGICDSMIEVSKQSEGNMELSEKAFPVLISTQWTGIYDTEIQEMLGFYCLCRLVSSKAKYRSVRLGVCPVQFALYLKLRCDTEQLRLKNETCDIDSAFKAHLLCCKANPYASDKATAFNALQHALRNYSLTLQARWEKIKSVVFHTGSRIEN